MPLLNDDIRRQLIDLFTGGLQNPVTLHFFTQKNSVLTVPSLECQTCHDAGELLKEIADLSDKLKLETRDLIGDAEEAKRLGVDKIPGIVMQGQNKGTLRYFGVPAGYEFGVVVEDLVDLSKGATRLAATTRKQLTELSAPVHIQVLVTPT